MSTIIGILGGGSVIHIIARFAMKELLKTNRVAAWIINKKEKREKKRVEKLKNDRDKIDNLLKFANKDTQWN